MEEQEQEFLRAKGDRTWLAGVDHAPPKIRALQEVSALLFYQPWSVTEAHIEVIPSPSLIFILS